MRPPEPQTFVHRQQCLDAHRVVRARYPIPEEPPQAATGGRAGTAEAASPAAATIAGTASAS